MAEQTKANPAIRLGWFYSVVLDPTLPEVHNLTMDRWAGYLLHNVLNALTL